MPDNNLMELADRLEREAEAADLDEERRQGLRDLAESVRLKALAPQPEAAGDEKIEDAVQDALTDFELSHPRLTAVLSNILTTLSSLGI